VVPQDLQAKVVTDIHKSNHPGVRGTLAAVQQYYWFRNMKARVKDIVRHCPECTARKEKPFMEVAMAPDKRPMALGGRWHIDGLQLPPSGEFDHLMVATDVATKYVILRPCRGEIAEAATGLLMDIIRRFGRPREITSDRGRAFMSHLFIKACQDLFITFKLAGTGRPQANGAVERVNRTLSDIASIACHGKGDQWSKYVGEIEYAINTRVSSITGYTPYELVFGRLPPEPTYVEILEGGGRSRKR